MKKQREVWVFCTYIFRFFKKWFLHIYTKYYLEEDEPVEGHAKRDHKEHVCQRPSTEEEEVGNGGKVHARSARAFGPAPSLVASINYSQRTENTNGNAEISLVILWFIGIIYCKWYLKYKRNVFVYLFVIQISFLRQLYVYNKTLIIIRSPLGLNKTGLSSGVSLSRRNWVKQENLSLNMSS